ncbi:MAG: tRNA guanosine(34) transglycosylase Tgt [Chlorobi bacterium]|nr:tRNA guanosine(34) transglycosylase Tgt [Chlorobiota bacterium]
MSFTLHARDKKSEARAGILETSHGPIETPVFMPVGTAGTVKAVPQQLLKDIINAPVILGNTYHLYLRPGTEVLRAAGGLHRFINWDRNILTDSGGYQVFSLSDIRHIEEKGVWFHSHIDGSKHFFTPENVVEIQRVIGADIMMALDECTAFPANYSDARISMELTHRWLERGWKKFTETKPEYNHGQLYFPIVQGSVFPELRKNAAEEVKKYDAAGYAIGGLSVGEPEQEMYHMIEVVNAILPDDKPRYLMGVGTPVNILESIARGVDMFDCVMPTRNGRNGMLFTSRGILNIRNRKWHNDFSPIDPEGTSVYSTDYSKAYLRHLFRSKEILGPIVASVHNLSFYLWLMNNAREKIINGDFSDWMKTATQKFGKRL